MTEPIHVRARKFLQEFFNDEDLTNFCFDYFPQVYNDFSQGMPKGQKVRMLVENSQRRGRFNELLAALERERPKSYPDRFSAHPYLIDPVPQEKVKRNPRQIFISHAYQDGEFAQRLAVDLQSNGWQTWRASDNIRPGEKWVEAINRGFSESGVFVLLLTPAAVASRWVQSEMNVAIGMEHRGEIQLLPLNLKPAPTPALWGAYQWISFNGGYEAGLSAFLGELESRKASLPTLKGVLQLTVQEQSEESTPKINFEDSSNVQIEKPSFAGVRKHNLLQIITRQIKIMPKQFLYGGGITLLIALLILFWSNSNYSPAEEPAELTEVAVFETEEPAAEGTLQLIGSATITDEPAAVTLTLTSTITATGIATLNATPAGSRTPLPIPTATPTSSRTPLPTPTATEFLQSNQELETLIPTVKPVIPASIPAGTLIPSITPVSSLQTPDVYPLDEVYIKIADNYSGIEISSEGSQFSKNTVFDICVGMSFGRDLNKEGITGKTIGGYRIVYNGSIGDFVSVYEEIQSHTSGCRSVTLIEPGYYEVWAFACTPEYACGEGEGWESSSPVSFTIISE